MNLRKDAYHNQDTVGEVQHLVDLYSSNKAELSATLSYLEKKVTNLALRIKSRRENLVAFLDERQIDYALFPAFESVISDDVYPDTGADQNIGSVEVEKAMRKNIPDEIFILLKEKILVKIHYEINDRIDELKRIKLHKAKLEGDMLAIQRL
jgi:hypothetical protein